MTVPIYYSWTCNFSRARVTEVD